MPIQLRTPGKGGSTKATLPAYFFRSKEEQATRLLEFVKDVESASYVYYTEDVEYGRELLNSRKDLANVIRLESNASPYMKSLLTAASAVLTMEELEETLWKSVYPTPTSTNSLSENSLIIVGVGSPEQTLRGFAGKVNKKPTQDLYGSLCEGLPEDLIEELRHKTRAFWEDDTLSLNYDQYAWEGVVDEALFAQLTEEKAPAALKAVSIVNYLTDTGREAILAMTETNSPKAISTYLTHLFGKSVVVARADGGLLVDGVSI